MGNSAGEHFDIQGILRGYGYRFSSVVYSMIRLSDSPYENQDFLDGLPGRLGVDVPTSVSELEEPNSDIGVTIALSHRGLERLGVRPAVLQTFPTDFIDGMAARASINGDAGRSDPNYWDEAWRAGVDLLIGINTASEEQRAILHDQLRHHLADASSAIFEIGFDYGQKLKESAPTVGGRPGDIEHFGFRDGMSNTPIRGISKGRSKDVRGSGRLDKDGKWHPLAAGEFLFGYVDEIGEIPESPMPMPVAQNGTFLVYRKLSEDVDRFRSYTKDLGERSGLPPRTVAEKMMGRRRNGEPLVEQSGPSEGPNDFDFAQDQRGRQCPLGSHIRRVNPRNSFGPETTSVDRHHIVRRSITYGRAVPSQRSQAEVNPLHEHDGEEFPGQGLLFVALAVDIARQFEFIQRQWVNDGNDLNQGIARDPIAGMHEAGSGADRMIFSSGEDPSGGRGRVVICEEIPRFVETRGGDYFFVPGIEAYRRICAGEFGSTS